MVKEISVGEMFEEVAAMPEVQSAVLAALNAQGIQFKSIDHAVIFFFTKNGKNVLGDMRQL